MTEGNKTEGTNAYVGQAEEGESFGTCNPRNTIIALFRKAAHHLTADELKWLTGLSDFVETETENLSENLMAIGCLVGADKDAGSFQSPHQTSNLLFSLSNQLSTLSGMAHIAAFAQDRLDNADLYANAEVAK